MVKRRLLKDAVADPMVEARRPVQKSSEKKPSHALQKIMISVVSILVGAVAGVFFNRYLKIF
jgi:hypothetical protein